jgi:hypothetical protein
MILGPARAVALSIRLLAASCLVVLAARTAAADDAANARDPWARFPPGSWIEQRSTNDYSVDGKARHDVTTERITLKSVSDKGAKLVTETKGSGEGDVSESMAPPDPHILWTEEDLAKATREKLTIDGKEIACAIIRFDHKLKAPMSFGDDAGGVEIHAVGTAWWSDAYPVPLKLELETTFGGDTSRRRVVAEKLDVEVKVGERTLHCVESVVNEVDAQGKPDPDSESREWSCADVPGGTVRSRSENRTKGSESTFVTELVDFFVAAKPAVTRTKEALPAPPPSGACEITGRFTLAGGRPAEGLKVRVSGRTHDVEAAAKAGAAPKNIFLEGATDAEGRLKLDVEALPGAEYFVEVRGPGLVKEVWRLRGLTAGGHVELGEIETRTCGAIVGKMETPDGRPVPGGFYVMARLQGGAEEKRGANRESMYEYGMPEKGSSEYRVDNIPAGTYEVAPYVQAIGWFKEGTRTVEVTEGQESRLDLTYTGPDLSQRVHIVVFVEPFYTIMPSRDHARLETSDGRTFAAVDGGMQAFNFDGVPPGSCTLTIDDPRFEKVVRTGLRAGSRTDIRLQPAGSIVVVARDAKSSAAILDVSVSQEMSKSNSWPRRFTVRGLGGPPLVGGVLHGLLPGDSRLFIGAKGYAETSIDLKGLKPDEARTIEVALNAGGGGPSALSGVIAGVVRDAKTKKPAAGVSIEAQCSDRDRWDTKSATSDGRGAYRFEGLAAGGWSVQAKRSETVASANHRIVLDGGERREDVDLELPPGVAVKGSVAGLAAFAGTEPGLEFRPGDKGSVEDRIHQFFAGAPLRRLNGQAAELGRDGSFVVKSLAPGSYSVELEFGGVDVSLGPSSSMHSPTHHVPLGEVEVTDAADQRFEFDAGSVAPGTVTVRVDGDATIRGSLLVVARPADFPKREESGGESIRLGGDDALDEDDEDDGGEPFDPISGGDAFGAGAFNDIEGDASGALANLGPEMGARLVLPAGRWIVGVRRGDGAWNVELPRPFDVAAGVAAEAEVKLELRPGSIRLVDAATRAPLANESIRWRHSTASRSFGVTARTDGDGMLALLMPSGTVKLSIAPKSKRRRADAPSAVEVAWPPGADPVELSRPSKE